MNNVHTRLISCPAEGVFRGQYPRHHETACATRNVSKAILGTIRLFPILPDMTDSHAESEGPTASCQIGDF
jgi:hypothetical protein